MPPAIDTTSLDAMAPFTALGDPDGERRIREDLAHVRDRVQQTWPNELSMLVLVGGYARGEGGLVHDEKGVHAYNDYDLVAVFNGKIPDNVHHTAELLSEELRIEVELWPVTDALLADPPHTLFWTDVIRGGARVLLGDPTLIPRPRATTTRHVPLEEATRLLANRAVGIALSQLEAEDYDHRKARHGNKMVLACGDALLLSIDAYPNSVRGRLDMLRRLEGAPRVTADLVEAYASAASFRTSPHAWHPPDGDLEQWFAKVVALCEAQHMAFEGARLSQRFDPLSYASHAGRIYGQLQDVSAAGRTLSAVRAWAKKGTPLLPWVGHPRERLARVATLIAYRPEDPSARELACSLLGADTEGSPMARLGADVAKALGRGKTPAPSNDDLHAALRRLNQVAG